MTIVLSYIKINKLLSKVCAVCALSCTSYFKA